MAAPRGTTAALTLLLGPVAARMFGLPASTPAQQQQMQAAGGDGAWVGADDGKTYASKISVTGPATLKVEGCVGAGLCGGENWSRSSR